MKFPGNSVIIGLIVVVTGCVSFGCNRSNDHGITVIDIASALNHRSIVKLSDFADDIRYIPIETSEDCLIGEPMFIRTTGDLIFIGELNQAVKVFDLSGSFLREIGKIGQGPGEYGKCGGLDIDESKNEVYINDVHTRKIQVFDFEGNWLRNIGFPVRGFQIYRLPGGGYLVESFRPYLRDSLAYKLIVTDEKGEWLGGFKEPITDQPQKFGTIYPSRIFQWNDGVYVYRFPNDTLYELVGNQFLPRFILDLGKFGPSGEEASGSDFQSSPRGLITLFYPNPINKKQLRLTISTESEQLEGYVDTHTQEVTICSQRDTTFNGWVNDIDGGPGYVPAEGFFSQLGWLGILSPLDLISSYQSGYFDFKNAINPEKAEALRALLDTLKEDDNPVLMIVIHK